MSIMSLLALAKAKKADSQVGFDQKLAATGIVQTPVTITAASATVTNDKTKFYLCDRASAQSITVPQNLTDFAIGSVLTICQLGVGVVTIVAGSGVTIRKSSTTLAIGGQNKAVQLIKIAANEWLALGSLT